jgi:predicted HTH domain antitoxin
MSSLLYGIGSLDPLSFALAPLALAVAVAALFPTWRALRVDPHARPPPGVTIAGDRGHAGWERVGRPSKRSSPSVAAAPVTPPVSAIVAEGENVDMQIALELPEDIAKRLELVWRDVSRGTLEAIAVEGYREGALTRGQVERLLGLSFWETEAFLKERQSYLAYTEEDFEQDRRDLDRLLLR